ncbi:MAG: hypothetical protein GY810_17230 [Aureispira sp.]|nr:hypothetical protein [Aureispira sp.]
MKEALTLIVTGGLLVGILTVGLGFWRRTFMQVEEQWKKLAQELNWDIMVSPSKWRWLKRQYPAMRGILNGFEIHCLMTPVGSGYGAASTQVNVLLDNSAGYTMMLYHKEANTKETLKGKAFEDCFVIESNYQGLEKRLFTPTMQQLVLDKGGMLKYALELDEHSLNYKTTVQIETDELRENFKEFLELCTNLAQQIQKLK